MDLSKAPLEFVVAVILNGSRELGEVPSSRRVMVERRIANMKAAAAAKEAEPKSAPVKKRKPRTAKKRTVKKRASKK